MGDGVLRRLPGHGERHATMADMHHEGRYDRMSNDVLTITRRPLSVQEFVGRMRRHSPRLQKRTPRNGSTKDEKLDHITRYVDGKSSRAHLAPFIRG